MLAAGEFCRLSCGFVNSGAGPDGLAARFVDAEAAVERRLGGGGGAIFLWGASSDAGEGEGEDPALDWRVNGFLGTEGGGAFVVPFEALGFR